MKRYETIFINHVDQTDEELTAAIGRYSEIISNLKGIIIKTEKWGKRKLAYLINKQRHGFYVFIEYAADAAVVTELERNFKIDDKILKYMTILKDADVTREGIEKEIADGIAREAVAAGTAEAPPAPEPLSIDKHQDATA